MVSEDRQCQVEIEEMTLGPYGVGHLDGKALLVANSAPGDVLQVSVSDARRDYSVALLEKIVSPGPSRRVAPCPFLPRCGGCDWQQITYRDQAAAKGRLIAAQLRHALSLELDPRDLVVPAPAEFGYRSRLRLKARNQGALGFFELGSNRFVAVDRCLLAGEAMSLDSAGQLASALGAHCDEVEIVKAGRRQVLVAYLRARVQPADIKRATEVRAANDVIAGIVLRGGGARAEIGEVSVTVELEPGMQLTAEADAFSQVNQDCNRALVASVMEQAAIEAGAVVLDLFCGAGNFSLPAARRGARVLGVDADPVAIGAAQRNAAALELSDARFVAMEAQGMAPFLLKAGYRPQAVILDPPRSGARQLMSTIVRLRAARVLYVSCDVATLVRDLRILMQGGYAVSSVKAFDFFPNTHHCEVLALLT
jgi:23S rRNA (uracil1939-C5)-methyltransferase